jgi:hypothetical protein
MMSTLQLRKVPRFMGLRNCPACGELLFAADAATFTQTTGITLRWSCDSCDHSFETTEEAISVSAHAIAA